MFHTSPSAMVWSFSSASLSKLALPLLLLLAAAFPPCTHGELLAALLIASVTFSLPTRA